MIENTIKHLQYNTKKTGISLKIDSDLKKFIEYICKKNNITVNSFICSTLFDKCYLSKDSEKYQNEFKEYCSLNNIELVNQIEVL